MSSDLFEPVSPEEVSNLQDGTRGRVSYPVTKGFLESGEPLVKLNRQKLGTQRTAQSLSMGLSGYIKKHELPIKAFVRDGELYMMRLDMDREGNLIPDWKQKYYPNKDEAEPEELTPSLIEEKARQHG